MCKKSVFIAKPLYTEQDDDWCVWDTIAMRWASSNVMSKAGATKMASRMNGLLSGTN